MLTNVETRRRSQGWSRAHLGRRAGVSSTTIRRIENRSTVLPKRTTRQRIAVAFDARNAWSVYGEFFHAGTGHSLPLDLLFGRGPW